jgi:pimeloyl-ACP methyl ester carboxylesterase
MTRYQPQAGREPSPARNTVIFLHGFASSGRGTKAHFFRQKLSGASPNLRYHAFEFHPMAVDFEYVTVTGMINRLRQFVLDRVIGRLNLIGSSMGGLVAVHYAHRFGGVDRLLLLAPALIYRPWSLDEAGLEEWREVGTIEVEHFGFGRPLPLRYDLAHDGALYSQPPPPACPTTIFHGSEDEVVPVSFSRSYAASYPELIDLVELGAGHDLNEHLERIWELWEMGRK